MSTTQKQENYTVAGADDSIVHVPRFHLESTSHAFEPMIQIWLNQSGF